MCAAHFTWCWRRVGLRAAVVGCESCALFRRVVAAWAAWSAQTLWLGHHMGCLLLGSSWKACRWKLSLQRLCLNTGGGRCSSAGADTSSTRRCFLPMGQCEGGSPLFKALRSCLQVCLCTGCMVFAFLQLAILHAVHGWDKRGRCCLVMLMLCAFLLVSKRTARIRCLMCARSEL